MNFLVGLLDPESHERRRSLGEIDTEDDHVPDHGTALCLLEAEGHVDAIAGLGPHNEGFYNQS